MEISLNLIETGVTKMKKLLMVTWVMAVVLMAVYCATSPAMAQYKYTVSLATSDTGVTTPTKVALSGVTDPLILDGGEYKRSATDTTLKVVSSLPSGNAMLYIDTVTVSQAALGKGGTNSGNTFFMVAKFGHAASNFDLLEKIPLALNMALSDVTAYGIPFQIPPGTEWARFYFGPSGITAYGNFKASLVVGIPGTDWKPPQPILLDTLVFAYTSTTGTSVFSGTDSNGKSMPPGTRFLECQTDPTSGVTCLIAEGGAVIDTTNPPYIDAADKAYFSGSLATLKAISIKTGSKTGYLIVRCKSGNPYVR